MLDILANTKATVRFVPDDSRNDQDRAKFLRAADQLLQSRESRRCPQPFHKNVPLLIPLQEHCGGRQNAHYQGRNGAKKMTRVEAAAARLEAAYIDFWRNLSRGARGL